jgi:hypothetical protein
MLALWLSQAMLKTEQGRSMHSFAQLKREHGSRTPYKRSTNSGHEPRNYL